MCMLLAYLIYFWLKLRILKRRLFGLESFGFSYFVSRWTYKPFGLDISELSDCTESEDDDPEARKKRIER